LTLYEAIAELMKRDQVLIGVDFDGTLAPLVAHPANAMPDPGTIEALSELVGLEGVSVVVISGRARDDLAARVGVLPGAILIGEHGNDVGQPVETPEVLEDARSFISLLQHRFPSATVEYKPRSVAFHTRSLDGAAKTETRKTVLTWATARPELTLLEGKEVIELTVALRTKGDAIAELAIGTDGTLYIGDDATDETVFRALGPDDLTVKVGEGRTAARYRVAAVPEVVEVLRRAALASA